MWFCPQHQEKAVQIFVRYVRHCVSSSSIVSCIRSCYCVCFRFTYWQDREERSIPRISARPSRAPRCLTSDRLLGQNWIQAANREQSLTIIIIAMLDRSRAAPSVEAGRDHLNRWRITSRQTQQTTSGQQLGPFKRALGYCISDSNSS